MKIITRLDNLPLCDRQKPCASVDSNLTFNRFDLPRKRRDRQWEYNVTLRVRDSRGLFARRGHSGRRLVAACWHAHYRFMQAIMEDDPESEIRTVRATYRGLDDFLARADATGNDNIGSMMQPLAYRDACDCEAT